jgi:hypothetical protein
MFTALRSTSIALFLIGIIVLLIPPGHLEEYAGYLYACARCGRHHYPAISIFVLTNIKADSKLEMDIVKPS